MRSVVFLIFLSVSFGDLDFNSKTRNFSVELLHYTVQDSNRDVVVSPYIIWVLLTSMAYETLGVTRAQVSRVLFLTEDRNDFVMKFRKLKNSVLVNKGGFKGVLGISLLNFLFYDGHFNVYPECVKRLENDFGFIAESLHFKEPDVAANSALQILQDYDIPVNNFIRTEDFVDTTIIICNYLEFGAKWYYPFNNSMVQINHQDGNKTIKAYVMMYTKAYLRFSNFESLRATVTEVPYESQMYCMLLIRPHSGHDVKDVFRNLRGVSLKDIFVKLHSDVEEFGLREAVVKLPEIQISSRVLLNKPLVDMGLSGLFDRNYANFDGFSEDDMYIGEIAHRVTVSFSQTLNLVHTNTPAYATDNRNILKEVAVKDPFIFLIVEKSTSTILFGGSYTKIDLF